MEKNDSEYCRRVVFPTGITLAINQGDITRVKTDAIVNAANKHLAHGGGVAAAIIHRGGNIIQKESNEWIKNHGPISFDKPAYTSGGNMQCKFIIHAVGPVWGEGNEEEKLTRTIYSSLHLADKLGAESISFPAISTGIFGFPVDQAAELFMKGLSSFGRDSHKHSLRKLFIILFDKETLNIFTQKFDDFFNKK